MRVLKFFETTHESAIYFKQQFSNYYGKTKRHVKLKARGMSQLVLHAVGWEYEEQFSFYELKKSLNAELFSCIDMTKPSSIFSFTQIVKRSEPV